MRRRGAIRLVSHSYRSRRPQARQRSDHGYVLRISMGCWHSRMSPAAWLQQFRMNSDMLMPSFSAARFQRSWSRSVARSSTCFDAVSPFSVPVFAGMVGSMVSATWFIAATMLSSCSPKILVSVDGVVVSSGVDEFCLDDVCFLLMAIS